MFTAALRLIRPKEWVKNLFILLPPFFGGKIYEDAVSPQLWLSFIAFCLAASSIYILNDILDVKEDRLHPVKCNRPIASGSIPVSTAIVLAILLAAVATTLAYIGHTLPLIGGYIMLNTAYSAVLKHISLVDISVISLGFILRIYTGGTATHIEISKWLVLMTFLLSMCLALGKRRDEILVSSNGQINVRHALRGYSLEFINMGLTFMCIATTICYIMYCVSPEVQERMSSDKVYLTSIFVILGLLRFLQIVIVEQKSGSPTQILLRDSFQQVLIICWAISFGILIYF